MLVAGLLNVFLSCLITEYSYERNSILYYCPVNDINSSKPQSKLAVDDDAFTNPLYKANEHPVC